MGTLRGFRLRRGQLIHWLITAMYPDAEQSLDYRMPTYRNGPHYVAWGDHAGYLSVYTCSAQRIAAFRKKHPKIPAGVGCLNFRDSDPFPVDDLAGVVRNALEPKPALLALEQKARRVPGAKPARK